MSNKVWLITGASRGYGRALAEALSRSTDADDAVHLDLSKL